MVYLEKNSETNPTESISYVNESHKKSVDQTTNSDTFSDTFSTANLSVEFAVGKEPKDLEHPWKNLEKALKNSKLRK